MKTRVLPVLLLLLLGCFAGQAGLLDDMGINSDASKKVKENPLRPRGKSKPPAQHSSAEGLPPLPLPVVPLRRTEKKNPPRPPVLIAKIAAGKREEWAVLPDDANNLLRWMSRELKVNFSATNIPINRLPQDAKSIPILYRSGQYAFELTKDQRLRLRHYVRSGGTIIFNTCTGHPDFARSAMREMQHLIPEHPPYRLAPDHPFFHAYYDIKPEQIRYRPFAYKAGAKDGRADVIGIDIECRTAVFLFRWDMSTGWDNMSDKFYKYNLGYDIKTSKLLGSNLMAYITTERSAAVPLSKALAYVDADKQKAGKFVIAQGVYHGLWKTREAGLSMLLNAFHEKTKTPVRFKRQNIALDSKLLFDTPFVYITGHNDFKFTDAERGSLRRYLARGGILFAEACCGRPSFDAAFRREIRQVLTGSKLARLPAEHMIFRFPNTIKEVTPRPPLARELKATGKIAPHLEGISLNGNLAVIYSPHGLSCGWELAQCPYCHGIDSNDSLALGVNILSFVLSQ